MLGRQRQLTAGLIFVALAVLGMAGCWNSDESAGAVDRGGVTVEIADERFHPPIVSVQRGERVTWVNRGTVPQAVQTWHTHPHPFDLHTIEPGESRSHTFEHPGRYHYFSSYDAALTGIVHVAGSMGADR